MNEKFDRKSAESTKLMKFGRQVESNALNAMVNVSFRNSSSNGRNDQLAGACEAPCSTRVGGASFFKNWKLILRSGRWRGHVSGRSDRLCGQFEQLVRSFRVGCGCWKLIGCFQFSKIRKQFSGSSANDGICSAGTSNSADCTDRQLILSLAAEKSETSRQVKRQSCRPRPVGGSTKVSGNLVNDFSVVVHQIQIPIKI